MQIYSIHSNGSWTQFTKYKADTNKYEHSYLEAKKTLPEPI